MYQLLPDTPMGAAMCVKRLSDNAFIPFAPDNTDYQKFKVNVEAGAELQDAEGNIMSQEAAIEFVRGLP